MATAQTTGIDASGAVPRAAGHAAELGARLLVQGALDEMALKRAERAQRQSGERLDQVLIKLGLVAEPVLTRELSAMLGLALAAASEFPDTPILFDQLEPAFLAANRLLPLALHHDRVVVAVADPFDLEATEALAFLLERPVERRLAAGRDIDLAIARLYGSGAGPAASVQAGHADGGPDGEEDARRLEDMASEAPIIRLVHEIIARAVEAQASDIHIEPREDYLRIRFRIDGMLHTIEKLSMAQRSAVTSRIKIMARLNIAERRLPQDGRFRSTVRGREIDLRVSTMPTMCGESVVLRILDRSTVRLDFAALGFGDGLLRDLSRLLEQPNGIILVTGPTGSGKTTTLYTALGRLNSDERKLFTVEDPIEYQLAGVNQIQVQPKIDLDFAHALRSILRQDPDVIMIGEIRDSETARIAIQASLTGHLVLSTVHTNSAAATITRLLDMGLEDYLLATSITGVVAQRLVRRLCPTCAAPAAASPALVERLVRDAGHCCEAPGAHQPRLRRPVGCPACRDTGYSGRTIVGELLPVTGAVRDAFLVDGTERGIETAAIAAGMRTMHQDGLAKVLAGETTLEEVLRVTRID